MIDTWKAAQQVEEFKAGDQVVVKGTEYGVVEGPDFDGGRSTTYVRVVTGHGVGPIQAFPLYQVELYDWQVAAVKPAPLPIENVSTTVSEEPSKTRSVRRTRVLKQKPKSKKR